MAVSLGSNAGFVLSRPTSDPLGTNSKADEWANVTKDISPSRNYKIVEMGWYCDNATADANFQLGLYDSLGVGDSAGSLLFSSETNKGTSAGWKTISSLNYQITPLTYYWLGMQLDATATPTNMNEATSGGYGYDYKSGSSLPNPFDGYPIQDPDGVYGIYALLEESQPTGTIVEQSLLGVNGVNLYGVNWNSQGFTIGTTGSNKDFIITHLGLKLYKIGNAQDVNISIRANSGGSPTGADLSTGTISASQLTTTSTGAIVYCQMTPFKMQKGVSYHIVARSPSSTDTSNMVVWKNNAVSSYAGGFLNYSGNSGVNWSQFTGLDAVFQIIGLEVTSGDDDAMISPLMLKPCLPL